MSQGVRIRVQDSLIPAALNALVNGGIAYSGFRTQSTVPISLDLISTQQKTVWGEGVTLAFALGVILTLITARLFASHAIKADASLAGRVQRPVFPFLLAVSLGNAMTLFGWFVAMAVLWQRSMGVVEVTPLWAGVWVGLLAGVITVVVEIRTKQALLRPA